MNLSGQHILSVKDFSKDLIEFIFTVAENMKPYALRQKTCKVLDGAILANMFFEPSTRTRVSFGCAFNRLGGQVRETTGTGLSALAKGESLEDMAQVISGYSDAIVMRHPEAGSVECFAKGSRIPVINGGDGDNEHPTQALLDLFTIQEELSKKQLSIEQLRLSLVGDLKHSRTVHSLCQLLALYPHLTLHLIAPPALAMPQKYIDLLTNAGHKIIQSDRLEDGLKNIDIIYQTRIQQERFASLDEANAFRGQFRLNKSILTQHAQSNTIIMHPLPRDSRSDANELDTDLNNYSGLAIFRQADNGVIIRMALFAIILDVHNQLKQHEAPVHWYVPHKP